jgi:hypothetical protein
MRKWGLKNVQLAILYNKLCYIRFSFACAAGVSVMKRRMRMRGRERRDLWESRGMNAPASSGVRQEGQGLSVDRPRISRCPNRTTESVVSLFARVFHLNHEDLSLWTPIHPGLFSFCRYGRKCSS